MNIIKKITKLEFIISFTTLFFIIPFFTVGKYVAPPEEGLLIKTIILAALYTSTLLLAFAFKNNIINIISILTFFVSCATQLLEYMSFATMSTTFNLAFYMTLTDINTLISDGKHFWLTAIFIIIYLSSLFALLVIICVKARSSSLSCNNNSSQKLKTCALCCAFVSIIFVFVTNSPHKNFFNMLKEINNANTIDTSDIRLEDNKKYGIKTSKIKPENLTTNKTKKNLIFIILESTEKTFLDQTLFPGLLPNLASYFSSEQTAAFTNMTSTASNTTCSMFETFFAIPTTPLIISSNQIANLGTASNSSNFQIMSKLVSLPVIYQKSGGSWTHIQGTGMFSAMADIARAAQLDRNWSKYLDYKIPRRELRDREVFEAAWEILKNKSQDNKPFAISISTIDAHAPIGRIDHKTIKFPAIPNGYPQSHKQLLDAMHTTDSFLGDFISKIQSHPKYKDTVVVIMSDHLTMANLGNYFRAKKASRKQLFLIMNSKHKGIFNTPGFTFDIAPTVLGALEITHNYTFMVGENLFSPQINESRGKTLSSDGLILLTKNIIRQTSKKQEGQTEINQAKIICDKNNNLLLSINDAVVPVNFYGGPIVPRNDDFMLETLTPEYFISRNEFYNRFSQARLDQLQKSDMQHILFCSTNSRWFKKLYNGAPISINAQYALASGNCQTGWNWSFAATPSALLPVSLSEKQDVKFDLMDDDHICINRPEYLFPLTAKKTPDGIVLKGSITRTLQPRIATTGNGKLEITGKLSAKNASVSVYIFPEIYDRNDIKLSPSSVLYIPDSEFYVSQNHQKGNSELHIVPTGNFIKKSKNISYIALYAKADLSDLPNKNTLRVIKNKRLQDGSIILTLATPLQFDVNKNTQGRMHHPSYFYRAINTVVNPQTSKALHFTENISYYTKIPNAGYIRICVALHPRGNKKHECEFTLENFCFGKKQIHIDPPAEN